MNKFEIDEQEAKEMFSIPYWVKDKKTAITFALHIQYRLFQTKTLLAFTEKKLDSIFNSEIKNPQLQKDAELFDEKYTQIMKAYNDLYREGMDIIAKRNIEHEGRFNEDNSSGEF